MRAALWGCAVGLASAAGGEAGNVVVGRNFHTVVPGRVYRSRQLSAAALQQVVRAHGIRTVINLRGCAVPTRWYLDECRATHRVGVSLEDVAFSAGRLPAVADVRRLLEVLDRAEYPVLLHCRQGADRTGLAAGAVLLLEDGVTLAQARRQLGPRYGHVAVDRAAYLDGFFDLYADWLAGQGLDHRPELFHHWAASEYCPGVCKAWIEPIAVPARAAVGRPTVMQIRAHNTSVRPWQFRRENNVGTHLCFVLKDAADEGVASGRFGLFEAEVPPGRSIDVTVVLPAVARPGHYRYVVDMMEEEHCWFYQAGSEPLEGELDVQ